MSAYLATEAVRTSDRLLSLQALRAIAALMVTVAHASEEAKYFFGFRPVIETDPFGKGVDLFFVISGFIIYYASRQGIVSGVLTARRFIFNRLVRVVPLYYIFTTLMVFVVVFFPAGVKEASFDPYQIISSYFFFPYERYDGRIAPILSLGWTLNYEIFFYLIFSACIFINGKSAALLVTTIIVCLAFLGVFLAADAPAALRELTDSIIIEFACGVVVAFCFDRYGRSMAMSVLGAMALMLSGFLLLYLLNMPERVFDLPRFVSAGLPSVVIVMAATIFMPMSFDIRVPKVLVALGDSSYSLYLSHRFIQRPVQMVLSGSGVGWVHVGVLYFVVAVMAACIFGHLVYVFLEKPLLRVMRKFSNGF